MRAPSPGLGHSTLDTRPTRVSPEPAPAHTSNRVDDSDEREGCGGTSCEKTPPVFPPLKIVKNILLTTFDSDEPVVDEATAAIARIALDAVLRGERGGGGGGVEEGGAARAVRDGRDGMLGVRRRRLRVQRAA